MRTVSLILVAVLSTVALSGYSAPTLKYGKSPTEYVKGYVTFSPTGCSILREKAKQAAKNDATRLDAANQSDIEKLIEQNTLIGQAENVGDRDCLASMIAPELAFLRVDGTIVDADGYLQKVKTPVKDEGIDFPRTTSIESVEVIGNRAIVKCVVTTKSADGEKRYHNLRLFIRYDGKWRLLGWANEELH